MGGAPPGRAEAVGVRGPGGEAWHLYLPAVTPKQATYPFLTCELGKRWQGHSGQCKEEKPST